MLEIILALVIGAAFGFTLDRIGATNPGYIFRMLNLTDMHLMRTILLGIGVASILTFGGLLSGLVDPGHLSVKDAYLGVFIGGLLLGFGWAISGYCPGTGLTALATGRFDALFFVIGGLVGAAAYMVTFASVKASGVLESIAGGKTTLGVIAGTKYPAVFGAVSGEMIGLLLGLAMIGMAWLLPPRIRSERRKVAAAE